MAAPAGSMKTGYEITNALGRLNADQPKLGQVSSDTPAYARAIAYFLRIIDLYCQGRGVKTEDVGKLTIERRVQGDGRIRWRITGP